MRDRWTNVDIHHGNSYDFHCKNKPKWDITMKWPPVKDVGEQLGIKEKESIFINGLGCGEWLQALHTTFPNTKLYGVDADPSSVSYVSKLVNGTYEITSPYQLDKLKLTESVTFDHAIADGILSIYSPEQQCLAVKQMLPLLKPGGSMYIGRNFEDCKMNSGKYITELKRNKINLLPRCFWSDSCLQGRPDIAEALYAYENDIYESYINKQEISACTTAVFIYKNIVISPDRHKGPLIPNSKLGLKSHKHECTRSTFLNSSKADHVVKESIKKAVKQMQEKGLDMH